MELMTQEIENKLLERPFESTDGQGKDAEVVVKYFNPYGTGTWLITEGEKQENGDWLLYGYMHISTWEWGYVNLSELEALRINVLGCNFPIERDLYSSGTVRELAD